MIALDFGTRSIICAQFDGARVTRTESTEHKTRAMREGSVFDLDAAREGLIEIRNRMGLAEGTPAAIAIAGAQLSTCHTTITLKTSGPWNESDLREAEEEKFSGIKSIGPRDVLLGVSRSQCLVDGNPVATPLGRDGHEATYMVLATFLPIENVKLKTRVIEQAGFQPTHITVEPMAIGSALFSTQAPPKQYALIDVGAGTSDIAVLSHLGILAVRSIPHAGDTITDSIARSLDLAYMDADLLKRRPDSAVTNIWGESKSFSRADVEEAAESGVGHLVGNIAAALKKLKRDAKLDDFSGVILVGGGSRWESLAARLAAAIRISPERIKVRTAESIGELIDETGMFRGPDFVTIAGIILSHGTSYHVRRFTFNKRPQLSILPPDRAQSFTVADAFAADNRDPLEYFGQPGEARVSVNGITGGEPGAHPNISLNGVSVTLDDSVSSGDAIEVIKGTDGRNAEEEKESTDRKAVRTVDAVAEPPEDDPHVVQKTNPVEMTNPVALKEISIDGKVYDIDRPLADILGEDGVISEAGLAYLSSLFDTTGRVVIDNEVRACGERYEFRHENNGVFTVVENTPPLLGRILAGRNRLSIRVFVNESDRKLVDRTRSARVGNTLLDSDARIRWDEPVITAREFWHVYDVIDPIEVQPVFTMLSVNGKPAAYTTPIAEGDQVRFT